MKMNDFKRRVMRSYPGMTQKEIAEKLGIKESTLTGYLNQTSELPNSVLKQFAEDGGTTVDFLLTGKENASAAAEKFVVFLIAPGARTPQPIDDEEVIAAAQEVWMRKNKPTGG